jgi:hypothetical protein
MSDRDENGDGEDFFRNQETRTRRAWVNRALEGVRRRLESGQGLPASDPPPRKTGRPRLYVVPSRKKR